jgi:predicted AAA+ superfamily ATPase
MATNNLELVGKGLELLRSGLTPFALREIKTKYRSTWWPGAVEPNLSNTTGADARRKQGTEEEKFGALDVQALLVVMWGLWNDVFQDKLGFTGRSYVSELREVRNRWAHQQSFSADDAYRAFDTITRLLEMVSAPEAEETGKLARELLRRRFEEDTKREQRKAAQAVTESGAHPALKPWREIATPHPDVASGKYRQAEFAADLSAVTAGYAEAEYLDPTEFFHRTYLTEGLTLLLSMAAQRLSGVGGEPVVDLQTNFGGGKTHSLLALYHLFSGAVKPDQVPGLEHVLQQAGVAKLPVAKRAVLVGLRINPATPQLKPDGTPVHTLWGDLAWQLGGRDGYSIVEDADCSGVNPGSADLKKLFDRFGPALVLIDEWVAFLRNLVRTDLLPAGSFEANLSFAQSLSEAASHSPNAMVVASLPQSAIEKGGPAGEVALDSLKQFFGRVAAAWKPASAEEGFEIVRRRLFQPIADFGARDLVCHNFALMYRAGKGEFPNACAEADYERRLKTAYPIHPELFDRLYQDWSTLEQFQRTRGVLRLMAAVIHELWEREDRSLLIMPGNVPVDSIAVRSELTRYLPEGWAAVIDTDVDGPDSRPLGLDREVPNLGRYSACRRVTRTVFLGSAPGVATQRVRGLEEVRIKLGCAQPGEAAPTFGDALRRLGDTLSHLFNDGNRYWFDVHRNIVREAQDRAAQYGEDVVRGEVLRRLRAIRERGAFASVHVTAEGGDVPDEQTARLVILRPDQPHGAKANGSPAIAAAQDILDNRGSAKRLYRNMLVFLAPDKNRAPELELAVRQYLAWKSILDDQEQLNLDKGQLRQAQGSLQNAETAITGRLKDTYCWLLVPTQEGTDPLQWDEARLSAGDDNPIMRASKRLGTNGQLITKWSAELLKFELDRWLWRDQPHFSVKKLWDCLCQYAYLPRLRDSDVLLDAIREGVRGRSYFGYATNVTDSHYDVLTFGRPSGSIFIDAISVLVKPEVAQLQLDAEAAKQAERQSTAERKTEQTGIGQSGQQQTGPTVKKLRDGAEQPSALKPVRFHGTVTLDTTRMGRDAGKIAEEIVQHLTALSGADVEVTLEIHAKVPDGVPDQVVRTVMENCRTMKFTSQGFEEE